MSRVERLFVVVFYTDFNSRQNWLIVPAWACVILSVGFFATSSSECVTPVSCQEDAVHKNHGHLPMVNRRLTSSIFISYAWHGMLWLAVQPQLSDHDYVIVASPGKILCQQFHRHWPIVATPVGSSSWSVVMLQSPSILDWVCPRKHNWSRLLRAINPEHWTLTLTHSLTLIPSSLADGNTIVIDPFYLIPVNCLVCEHVLPLLLCSFSRTTWERIQEQWKRKW